MVEHERWGLAARPDGVVVEATGGAIDRRAADALERANRGQRDYDGQHGHDPTLGGLAPHSKVGEYLEGKQALDDGQQAEGSHHHRHVAHQRRHDPHTDEAQQRDVHRRAPDAPGAQRSNGDSENRHRDERLVGHLHALESHDHQPVLQQHDYDQGQSH